MKNECIQKFIAYIILNLLIPLLPFIFEIHYTECLTYKTFILGAAMYGFALAMGTNNVASFALSLFYAIFMTASFGKYDPILPITNIFKMYQFYGLVIIILWNIIERYNRHIIEKEELFSFMQGGKK